MILDLWHDLPWLGRVVFVMFGVYFLALAVFIGWLVIA